MIIDGSQLTQILVNLVVNARDALPNGGWLRIQVTAPSEPSSSGASRVRLVVADNGCGMDDETVERVFEPFFTTKKAHRGVGLGLSVVHGIVAQAGGEIRCGSRPGEGTEMTVELPRFEGPASQAELRFQPASRAFAPASQFKLLLVEDEAAVRELAARILRRGGFEVLIAEDGQQALRIARDHPDTIDLLVTDIVMPRIDGRRLREQLAELRPDISVLYMSGYTDDEIARRGIAQPESAFLAKPFSASQLVAAVWDAIRSQRSG